MTAQSDDLLSRQVNLVFLDGWARCELSSDFPQTRITVQLADRPRPDCSYRTLGHAQQTNEQGTSRLADLEARLIPGYKLLLILPMSPVSATT